METVVERPVNRYLDEHGVLVTFFVVSRYIEIPMIVCDSATVVSEESCSQDILMFCCNVVILVVSEMLKMWDIAPKMWDIAPKRWDIAPNKWDIAPKRWDIAPNKWDAIQTIKAK